MFTFSGRRAIARLAMVAMCSAAAIVPTAALAGKAKGNMRSMLDQVLIGTDVGSWRTARLTPEVPAARKDSFGPARFFTINTVLNRVPNAPLNAVASVDAKLTSDTVLPASATEASGQPYGLILFPAPEGTTWSKWRSVDKQMQSNAQEVADCRIDAENCSIEAARLVALSDKARLTGSREGLTLVNSAVNDSIRYQNDFAHHGVADYWSAPIATLKDGHGDCEDYAIIKYFVLRQAGIAPANIKILLVRDVVAAQDHAVTVVRQDGHWLVLDNRWSSIVETSDASSLLPRYAVGEDGVKLFASRFASIAPDAMEFDLDPAASMLEAEAVLWSSFAY